MVISNPTFCCVSGAKLFLPSRIADDVFCLDEQLTRHVPGLGFLNGANTLKEYFALPLNVSSTTLYTR